MSSKGWIGVDLDGTLAEYESTPEDQWDPLKIGKPIPRMVERVKGWLAAGVEVRIVTARVWDEVTGLDLLCQAAIQDWLEANGMGRLTVQCHKDYNMVELWDDRAVTVQKNTGKRLSAQPDEDGDYWLGHLCILKADLYE